MRAGGTEWGVTDIPAGPGLGSQSRRWTVRWCVMESCRFPGLSCGLKGLTRMGPLSWPDLRWLGASLCRGHLRGASCGGQRWGRGVLQTQ